MDEQREGTCEKLYTFAPCVVKENEEISIEYIYLPHTNRHDILSFPEEQMNLPPADLVSSVEVPADVDTCTLDYVAACTLAGTAFAEDMEDGHNSTLRKVSEK